MGFWNDGVNWGSRTRSRSSSSSSSASSAARKRRDSHRAQSTTSSRGHYASKPSFSRSASSFLGLAGGSQGGSHRGSTSRGRAGGSYTSPRPRSGFVARVRRFLRQIYEYMRKHPMKVFVLVIMPLITGGVLTKLLATVGIRLPRSVEGMLGSGMSRAGQGQRYYSRGGARDIGSGTLLPGMGGGMGESVNAALNIAKMFL